MRERREPSQGAGGLPVHPQVVQFRPMAGLQHKAAGLPVAQTAEQQASWVCLALSQGIRKPPHISSLLKNPLRWVSTSHRTDEKMEAQGDEGMACPQSHNF